MNRKEIAETLKKTIAEFGLQRLWEVNRRGENIFHLLCRLRPAETGLIMATLNLAKKIHDGVVWAFDDAGQTPLLVLFGSVQNSQDSNLDLLPLSLLDRFIRDRGDVTRVFNAKTGETVVCHLVRYKYYGLLEHLRARFGHGFSCPLMAPVLGVPCPREMAVRVGFDLKACSQDCRSDCGASPAHLPCFQQYESLEAQFESDRLAQTLLRNRLIFLDAHSPIAVGWELAKRGIEYLIVETSSAAQLFLSLTSGAPADPTPLLTRPVHSMLMFGDEELSAGSRKVLERRKLGLVTAQLARLRAASEFSVFILRNYSHRAPHIQDLIERAPPLFRFVVIDPSLAQLKIDDVRLTDLRASARHELFYAAEELAARELVLFKGACSYRDNSPGRAPKLVRDFYSAGSFFLTRALEFSMAKTCFKRARIEERRERESAESYIYEAMLELCEMRAVWSGSIMEQLMLENASCLLNEAHRRTIDDAPREQLSQAAAFYWSTVRSLPPETVFEVRRDVSTAPVTLNEDMEFLHLERAGDAYGMFLYHIRLFDKVSAWRAFAQFEASLLCSTAPNSKRGRPLLAWPRERTEPVFDLWRIVFSRAILLSLASPDEALIILPPLPSVTFVIDKLELSNWTQIDTEWDTLFSRYAACLQLGSSRFPAYWHDHIPFPLAGDQRAESLKLFIFALALLRHVDMAERDEYAGWIYFFLGRVAEPSCKADLFRTAITYFYSAYQTFDHENIA